MKSDSIEFRSINELYNRVLPALRSKTDELKKMGYKYIIEKDVWDYLVEKNWKNKNNLELYELIKDILYLDSHAINEYVINKMNRLKRDLNNKETEVL